jgi:anti-anti-sigma factor
MDILEEKKDAIVLLGLVGRLDSGTSPQMEEKVVALLNGGAKQVVVDFARLDYISSAGLRVLLMAAKKLKASGGVIALCALKPHIREVFDIAGFTAMFPIHDSAEQAVRSLTNMGISER